MNDVDGMKILKLARERLPDCEVVMVTGHATVPLAVEAMQQGAFNFLEKPITPNRVRAIAEKAAQAVALSVRTPNYANAWMKSSASKESFTPARRCKR